MGVCSSVLDDKHQYLINTEGISDDKSGKKNGFDLDHRTQQIFVVYGYVHWYERELDLAIIPSAIIQLIILFYTIEDKWDKTCCDRANVLIVNDHNILNKDCSGQFKNAYLSQITEKNSGIYHWKFKVINIPTDKQYVVIGISSSYEYRRKSSSMYTIFDQNTLIDGFSYG